MTNKIKILSIDSMSTYATFDGKVANTYSVDKNCKEFSFYSKMLPILMRGQYDIVIIETSKFQMRKGRVTYTLWNNQYIQDMQVGILKVICHPLKTKVVTVTPKEVKKLFTGSGNAKKEDMMAECDKRGIKWKTEHEADAIGIYHSYKEKYNVK